MKIDFYILATNKIEEAHHFTCELVEKLYTEKASSIFLHTESQEQAEHFDLLLWTYRDDSFLPHAIYTKTMENMPPILISHGETPPSHASVLFNLHQDIPPFFQAFNHIIEIVFTNTDVQQLARHRYKQYRDHGLEINTIKLS